MRFDELPEFSREFAKLCKKYKNLEDDLEILKKAIKAAPGGNGTKHWNVLKVNEERAKFILKLRLRSRFTRSSEFRVIYFYDEEQQLIIFIEIYFKGKKENEDKNRIKVFWSKFADNL